MKHEQQAVQLEFQRQQLEAERQQQAARLEMQHQQQAAALNIRRAEIRFQEQRTADEMRLRREESDCMRARGEQAAERENSLAAQTKRYGDILKRVAAHALRPWQNNKFL